MSEISEPGTAVYIGLAITLTLMVGAIQLAAGLARLGGLISFVSHSVITGFTAAAAILIAASQLGGSLGIATERGGGVMERLHRVWEHFGDANLTAIYISLVTLVVLLGVMKIDKRRPSYVLAFAAGSIMGIALDAPNQGVAMFETLASVIPSFVAPEITLSVLRDLLPSAFAVAFIGLLEAISIGKGFAMRRQENYDSNQEIIGQGMGNFIGSFVQSYAGSGSFTPQA